MGIIQNYELSTYEILFCIRFQAISTYTLPASPCLLGGQITSHLRWQLVLELGNTPGAIDDANSVGLHVAGHVLGNPIPTKYHLYDPNGMWKFPTKPWFLRRSFAFGGWVLG